MANVEQDPNSGEAIIVDPRSRAEFWASQGIPFATHEFAIYANLAEQERDSLMTEAHLNAAERAKKLSLQEITDIKTGPFETTPKDVQWADYWTRRVLGIADYSGFGLSRRQVLTNLFTRDDKLGNAARETFITAWESLVTYLRTATEQAKPETQAHLELAKYLQQRSEQRGTI
ncbi:hypothetical protein HYU92_00835 [Candidatus Curtissbacteria bacterium]|nr:hypothetical protein [Candidatus Curtissbacteria bacterium]